jgi:hypothetical protein
MSDGMRRDEMMERTFDHLTGLPWPPTQEGARRGQAQGGGGRGRRKVWGHKAQGWGGECVRRDEMREAAERGGQQSLAGRAWYDTKAR